MNPGFGAPELLVLAVVALIVIGPKDLPQMFRRIGRFVGQARAMARDFQRSFDEMGRESEMADLRKEIEALKAGNPANELKRELEDVRRELADLEHEDIVEKKIAAAEKAKQDEKPPEQIDHKPDAVIDADVTEKEPAVKK
ncbi:Sec-independent protein translocase protein TatB [Hyphobacterium sp.]|uniref:Sec-independent protein translocase protein TatB n=1 Tax=Hyphobacterium sp. TaxID=2004662 RepID=UPI003BAC213F